MSDEDTLHPVVFNTADPSQGFFARKLPPSDGGNSNTSDTGGTKASVYIYNTPTDFVFPQSPDGEKSVAGVIKIPLSFAVGSDKAPHKVSLLTELNFLDEIDVLYTGYRVHPKVFASKNSFHITSINHFNNVITTPEAPGAASAILPAYARGLVADTALDGYRLRNLTSALDFIICPNGMNVTGNGEHPMLPPPVATRPGNMGMIRLTQGKSTMEFWGHGIKAVSQDFIGMAALPYFDTLELTISGIAPADARVSGRIIMTVL